MSEGAALLGDILALSQMDSCAVTIYAANQVATL